MRKTRRHGYVFSIFIAALSYSSSVLAWMSGEESMPGPERAKKLLTPDEVSQEHGDPNEHGEIMREAFIAIGVPQELIDETFTLKVYVEDADTLIPGDFSSVNQTVIRALNVSGFSGLPDHSYSFWDWLSGNETCPNGAIGGTPEECHTFTSHMGAVNSNHFLPQAGYTYEWYHELALASSSMCYFMEQQFNNSPFYSDNKDYIDKYIKECQILSLTYEAVGQHFLQDAWAVGHMWERWGFTDARSFPDPEARGRALIVAATAGLLHGCEAVCREEASILQEDPLSFGLDNAFITGSGDGPFAGAGDLHLDEVETLPKYSKQRSEMYACSEAGAQQVWRALHGESTTTAVDPTGPACLGQKVTNHAVNEGWGLVSTIGAYNLLPAALSESAGVPISENLANQWRADLTSVVVLSKVLSVLSPEGDFAGSQMLLPLAEVDRNSDPTGSGSIPKLGPYLDPSPYEDGPLGSLLNTHPDIAKIHPLVGDSTEVLTRSFNRALMYSICEDSGSSPEVLRDRVTALRNAGTTQGEEFNTACSVCTEITARQIPYPIGQSGAVSMCANIGAQGEVEYEPVTPPSPLASSLQSPLEIAAADYCGCAVKGAEIAFSGQYNETVTVDNLTSPVSVSEFQLFGVPGSTCGGEVGGPLYSSFVQSEGEGEAVLYPAGRSSGQVAGVFGRIANRKTCSSFVALRNANTPDEQVWINAADRSWQIRGSFISDRSYQLRYYSGHPTDREGTKRCEIGWSNVEFGNFGKFADLSCEVNLSYEAEP